MRDTLPRKAYPQERMVGTAVRCPYTSCRGRLSPENHRPQILLMKVAGITNCYVSLSKAQ